MKPSRQADYRAARYSGKNTINMAVDLGDLNDMIAGLEEEVDAAIRPAAQAGAEVIYQVVLRNVDQIGSKSGRLRGAIYQAFSEENSTATAGGYKKATYHVSYNARKAPHGLLIEYGHIQRYAVRLAEDGNWYTLVKPSMRGKPKPKRGASQATKDAYYVLRQGGPVQIPAQPFMRPAFYRQGDAIAAVEAKFWETLEAKK